MEGSDVASAGGIIGGFADGTDHIQDDAVQFSQVATYTVAIFPSEGDETFTFFDSSGHTLDSITVTGTPAAAGSYDASVIVPGSLVLSAAANGDLLVTPQCFLPGTLLATPNGEIAVEALLPGMTVAIREGGVTQASTVRRVIRRSMDAAKHGNALDAYPVRIRAGAFGDGLPQRDLLLTGEHCVLTEGGLVPVRMLVNGGTILRDLRRPCYDHYHVDLGEHAILVAEGLETESHYGEDDTAERGTRAAPLTVDRATVEPIWRRLAARATRLGFPPAPFPAVEDDPDLHLVGPDGSRIVAAGWDGDRATFPLPLGVGAVRIASRAARPDRTLGPFVDDRRMLGVKIGAIELQTSRRQRPILLSDNLPGWHAPEWDGRWTNGYALLPLGRRSRAREVSLTLHVVGRMRYRAAPQAA
jgi:hypothetical protein